MKARNAGPQFARFAAWCGILFCCLVAMPIVAHGQKRWQFEVPLRAGVYLPATPLGSIGPAEGRMRAAVMYGVGLELRRRVAPLGVRLSFVNPLTAGARFAPTPQCVEACEPYRDPYPIFQAVALDLTFRVRAGPARLQLAAGPGFRAYSLPRHVCICDAPSPGELQPFDVEDSRLVRHLGAEVRWPPLRPLDLGVQLEDYWGWFRRTGRQQHDLVLGLGVHIR